MPALAAIGWVGAVALGAATPSGAEVVRPDPGATMHVRPAGRVVSRLTAKTPYGSPMRLWVRARRDGWLKVSHMDAPGGAGWIAERRTSQASPARRRIVIDRSARRLSVLGGGRRWSTRVIVGANATPTPLGTFQITDSLDGRRFSGVYGGHVFPLSAYGSKARTSRLAIHGIPLSVRDPSGSAGCVRVPPVALKRLVREVAAGTPVRIKA